MTRLYMEYQIAVVAVVNHYNSLRELQQKLKSHGNWFTRLFVSKAIKAQRNVIIEKYLVEIMAAVDNVITADQEDFTKKALEVFGVIRNLKEGYSLFEDKAMPVIFQYKLSKLNVAFITAVHVYSKYDLEQARAHLKNIQEEAI